MENLNLTGTADFTDLFDALDNAEKRMREFSRVTPAIKPRIDLSDQFRQLDALEARLKKLGVSPNSTPRIPTPTTPTSNAPVGPTSDDVAAADAMRKRLAEIHNLAATLRNDFIAAGTATNVTDEEIAQLQTRAQALQGELRELRPIAEQTFGAASKEVRQLSLTTAQLQRTVTGARGEMSRLGIASQFKLGLDNSVLMQNPQQAVNGAVQLVRVYEQARLSSLSLQKTLERQNISVGDSQTFITKYAERFNVIPTAVEATMKVLLNNGYSMKQAQETLERYAASALVAAKDVGGAVDALASDVQMGTTVMSNQYGITANQATAWNQYAKSIGKSTDALSAEQKAEAYLVALRRETANDMRDADTILEGVGGTLGKTSQEFRKAQIELGEALLPTITNGAKELTKLIHQFNELDPQLKNNIVTAGTFLVAWGGIRIVLGPVIGLFKSATPLLKMLTQGAGKAGAARALGELGEAAAGAAGKSGTLNKGLIELSEVGKQKGLWAKLGDGVKLLFNPIRNGMPILGQFIKSLAASPVTKGGLYGVVFAIGYGIGKLIDKAKLLNGLTVGENVQNFSLKAFSGFSQEQVNQLRIEEARNAAFVKVLNQQAEARKRVRDETNKDLRASQLRTLNIERDLAVEQAALKRAQELGDKGATLAIQDRIKNLTQALGYERQNRATIDASILAAQRQADLEEKRRPVLEALKKTQAELADKAFEIRLQAKSDFASDFAQIEKDFREKRKALEAQLKGEKDIVIRAEIQTTLDKLDRVHSATVTARTTAELKDGAKDVAAAQREVEQARIDAMKEGAGKREAELTAELKRIRNQYGPQIKKALADAMTVTGPSRADFQKQAGQLQKLQGEAEKYARQTAAQDLKRIREEEQKKAQEHLTAAQEAEGRILQARAQAADSTVQVIEWAKARELSLYGQTADARLKIERRYEQALIVAQQQAALMQAQAEAAQLRRTYADQLRAAKEGGAQRGRLEAAARAEYLTNLATLEQTTAQKIKDIQLSGQKDVRDARLAVQQEVLDRELKNIGTATGAELASLRVRLQARRAAAISRGDRQTAEQLAAALRTVENLNTDRVRDLKTLIRDAGKGAVDLRQRLTDALPKDLVQKARSDAASPFNGIIRDAQAKITDLNKAYGKIGTPTTAQTAAFRKAVTEQQNIVRDAHLERNRAVLTAEQATNRDLLASKRQLARDEIDAALKVAQSDAERRRLQLQQLGMDKARLIEVNAELQALQGRVGVEERVNALKREGWALQEGIAKFTQDERQQAEALQASQINLARAYADRQEALALTDQEVIQARQARVALAVLDYQQAQDRLASAQKEGQSEEKLNEYRAARVAAGVQLVQADRALAALADQMADRELTAQQARARAAARVAGLADDAVATARIELGLTRQNLSAARARLADADRLNLAQEERVKLQAQIEEGQAGEADGERQLAEAMKDRLALARSIEEALRGVNLAAAEQGSSLQQAGQRVALSTEALRRARTDVQDVLSRVTTGKPLTEQDAQKITGLTDAIKDQRDAVRALGEEYARQVSSIDGLSDALKNANQILSPKTKSGGQVFSVQREASDLKRLEARRELALRSLEKAIQAGDPEQITQALGKVNDMEKTYREEVQRLQKEGYAPYLNLVDRQQNRVLGNVQAAQGVLDDLLEHGTENLDKAAALQKEATAATGDSMPVLAADAIAGALNTGSQTAANKILDSLTEGARIVSDAILKALGSVTTPPLPDLGAFSLKEGDVTNYGDVIIHWQGQQMPTPPDYREMFRQMQRMAADEARRNPCSPRR